MNHIISKTYGYRIYLLRVVLIFFLSHLIILSYVPNSFADEILVSAAMSLKDVFTDIAQKFSEKNLGSNAVVNFASSGQCQKQIEQGAQVDVFASASTKEINELETKGLIIGPSKRIFAQNVLVLVSYKKVNSINDLLNDEIQKISLGEPRFVPVGKYAKESLEHYGLYEKLKDKFIFAENVRQILNYVIQKEVDAGFVFKTDAMIAKDNAISVLEIDSNSHEKILYPIAVIKGTKNEVLSQQFIDFVISNDGLLILKKYGFMAPSE